MTETKNLSGNPLMRAAAIALFLGGSAGALRATDLVRKEVVVLSLDADGNAVRVVAGAKPGAVDVTKLKPGTLIEVRDISAGRWISISGLNVGSGKVLVTESGPRVVGQAVIYITEGVTKGGKPAALPIVVEVTRGKNGEICRWCEYSAILGLQSLDGLTWTFKCVDKLSEVWGQMEVTLTFKGNTMETTMRNAVHGGRILHVAGVGQERGYEVIGHFGDKECAPGFWPATVNGGIGTFQARPRVMSDDALIAALVEELSRGGNEELLGHLKRITGKDFGEDIEKWNAWWQKNRERFPNGG